MPESGQPLPDCWLAEAVVRPCGLISNQTSLKALTVWPSQPHLAWAGDMHVAWIIFLYEEHCQMLAGVPRCFPSPSLAWLCTFCSGSHVPI